MSDAGPDTEAGSQAGATGRDPPSDLLAAHPETAYFWGRVAADGECTRDAVTVRTNDETAAERLAAIAGAESDDLTHDVDQRPYAHDTALTCREETYVLQVFGDLGERAGAALGLPLEDAPGGYRFSAFADHDRELLRGAFEGCAAVCNKGSEDPLGIAFVHEDEAFLATLQRILDRIPVDADADEPEPGSSGYWFGVADAAVPDLAAWLYEGCEETGLFAPTRRRTLDKGLARQR